MANSAANGEYALELAKWQYRTGTGCVMKARAQSEQIQELATVPGVVTIPYETGWTLGPKDAPKDETALVTNVEALARASYKSVKRVDIEQR